MHLLLDSHPGGITGLAPHPTIPASMLSCSHDGSIRAWDGPSGQLVAKRHLGGKLTCLSSSLEKGLVAVGSEGGVVR